MNRASRPAAERSGAPPLVLRVVAGDIASAYADSIVINHFNGLAPSGAEKAVDDALGGAISRVAARGGLYGPFGSSRFFPATRTSIPADSVLVVGLGEPERFSVARLPEIGAAIVEAMAGSHISDVATIVHGAGGAGVDACTAAASLVRGILEARATTSGDRRFAS